MPGGWRTAIWYDRMPKSKKNIYEKTKFHWNPPTTFWVMLCTVIETNTDQKHNLYNVLLSGTMMNHIVVETAS